MTHELQDFDLSVTFQQFLIDIKANNLEARSFSKSKTKMKRFDQRITIRISKKILEQLTNASELLHETKSAFIKRSIASYLDYHRQVEVPLLQKRLANRDADYED